MSEVDDSLIALNNLAYKKIPELSVVNQRHLRRFVALRQAYGSGEVCYVDIAPGSEYWDPKNSFLKFNVAVSGGQCNPGTGSIASNILRTVVVRSRSGLELDRIERPNIYIRDSTEFECQRGWKSSVGSSMGWGAANIFDDGDVKTVCIPLSMVSPFFASNSYIPSVMGVLRLEITLERASTAFVATDAAPDYEVQDLSVHCDAYQLSDSVQRRLQVLASQSGLAYSWPSVHTTLASIASSSYTFVALKTASRALGAFCHCSTPDIETNPGIDSMINTDLASGQGEINRFQYVLGSIYLPAEPIVDASEAFVNANYSFNALKHCKEFSNDVSLATYVESYGVPSVTLERSTVLQQNGQSTSSSRPLLLNIEFANGTARNLTLFMQYLRMAIVFSDSNVVVRE